MPNPYSLVSSGSCPSTLVANTTLQTLTIETDRPITLAHDGENEVGTTTTQSIIFAFDYDGFTGNLNAGNGASPNKLKLINLRSATVGPGINVLRFQTNSGTCTFQAIPGEKAYGRY